MAAPHDGGSGGGGSKPQKVQFLSSVLSQRGPSGLPYSEDVKWLIRMHLLSLTDAYPSLSPKTASFTHNDGRSVNLLQADGTVPMTYHSVTYNIPVIIWLTESYPRYAPCVYVNPTRDMLIKQPHPYLDSSGLVRIPYLQNWIYPSSNLVELARNLSSYFERDPPLYSQRTNRPNLLTPNPNPNSQSGGSGWGKIFPGLQQQKPPQAEEDPNEAFRCKAISKIIEVAHGDIVELRKTREEEMDALVNVQQELRRRGGEVDQGLKEMRAEMEALEQRLQMILMNTDVLESWLGEENEAKLRGQEDDVVSVDQAFEFCDALSKQMLECACSDLAIEDVLYSLDKAVQDGTVPFEVYLKNVRLLSREQFFSRALGAKVKAAQTHSQVESMAARIRQFVG